MIEPANFFTLNSLVQLNLFLSWVPFFRLIFIVNVGYISQSFRISEELLILVTLIKWLRRLRIWKVTWSCDYNYSLPLDKWFHLKIYLFSIWIKSAQAQSNCHSSGRNWLTSLYSSFRTIFYNFLSLSHSNLIIFMLNSIHSGPSPYIFSN